MESIFDALLLANREGRKCALGVITEVKGSSPQKQGAKALFFEDGTIMGTMGGGCLEAEIQQRARQSLLSGEPAAFDLVLDHDFGWDDGLICGGKVAGLIIPGAEQYREIWEKASSRQTAAGWMICNNYSICLTQEGSEAKPFYTEAILPRFHLWIAGSGHIAQAMAPLAVQLDFEVTVFDDRRALANRQIFPEPTHLRVGSWDSILAEEWPREKTVYGLIVTRGHQHDALALKSWIKRPFDFLGMIGSRRKKRLIFSQFMEEGISSAEELEKVQCPVGLDIGSKTVFEIAISIAGQMVEWRAAQRKVAPAVLPHE
ncbi:MAG: XdhC/CoxI family protein [Verrucomicrobiales bacterium]|nr:XdhC/CoxI family protein [Verrucomicrobiales bacterium]